MIIEDAIKKINSNAKFIIRGSDIDTCEIEWVDGTTEISKDDIKSHDKFREKYKIKFDLLADEEIKVLKKYKVWGKKKFMGREFMGINRTTFLIDKKGKIIKIWKNVKVKDHAKEVLETLREFSKK